VKISIYCFSVRPVQRLTSAKNRLIIADCCLPPKLDQLTQRDVAEGCPKSLINQLDEGRPIWRPMVALDAASPVM
jgi:hypothetical protein